MASRMPPEEINLRRQISYLVHDLGPALASFETVINMVSKGELDMSKASHGQLVKDTIAAIAYSKLLIENLLEFTYLTKEKTRLTSSRIEWDTFLPESLIIPKILALEKNIEITYKILNPHLTTFADPGILRRIIHNLVTNSIKYCPPNSLVQIELKSHLDKIELHIKDNGPGLPDQTLSSIFEEGVQLNLRSSGHFKGVGIGLAFCKEASQHLDGSLTVKNIIPNGLEFNLSLPTK